MPLKQNLYDMQSSRSLLIRRGFLLGIASRQFFRMQNITLYIPAKHHVIYTRGWNPWLWRQCFYETIRNTSDSMFHRNIAFI